MNFLFRYNMNSYWYEKIDFLKQKYPECSFHTEPLLSKNEYDGIITNDFSEKDSDDFENIKIVFIPFAGVNHINTDLFIKKNIILSNSHGNGKIVAEKAVALLFALSNKLIEYHNDLKEGIWHGFTVKKSTDDSWESISGSTVSVLGTGEIGKNIAKYLKPFDVKIIGFKKNTENYDKTLFDEITNDIMYAVKESDIIFLCLPSTKDTENIITKKELDLMKEKFLINVGRGNLINERDLYNALLSENIKGFASDVWFNYPEKHGYCLPSSYPITLFRNVVVSPHVGGYTKKAVKSGIDYCIESISDFIEKGTPQKTVDLKNKY
ncbi:MAG: NAD(P)-binding domain-containing protein [Thermotogae bacterium]|nr:NAD(P)-binding domain-containing protein [Thermotogota bacterium]